MVVLITLMPTQMSSGTYEASHGGHQIRWSVMGSRNARSQ